MNELSTQTTTTQVEAAVIGGDLSKMSPEGRVSHYLTVCKSMGLNPLTRPFDYITLNSKLTLYARKDAADQLRKINGISIDKPDIQYQDDWIVVTVVAHDASGRCDSDVGVVNKKDMRGDFGNALMKAVTKAKRRVTLSICGLGWLDETEVETIPDVRKVVVAETGEIVEGEQAPEMTLNEARNTKTAKGTQLGTLDVEQLALIIEKTNDANLRRAASICFDALIAEAEEAEDGTV